MATHDNHLYVYFPLRLVVKQFTHVLVRADSSCIMLSVMFIFNRGSHSSSSATTSL